MFWKYYWMKILGSNARRTFCGKLLQNCLGK
uniref:Uncharacterized protein n=1 Tax=Heterorhabditis bacteriophora TaxID=37862 RepID=A0A1I7X1G3_HETBA